MDVYIDSDSKEVDVRPVWGKLFTLNVAAEPSPPSAGPSEITLSSDMTRIHVAANGFQFKSLPPGRYELYAEAKGPPYQAAYANIFVGGDMVHISPCNRSGNRALSLCQRSPTRKLWRDGATTPARMSRNSSNS